MRLSVALPLSALSLFLLPALWAQTTPFVAPWEDGFESGGTIRPPTCVVPPVACPSGCLPSGWTNDPANPHDWLVFTHAGPPVTPHTGPPGAFRPLFGFLGQGLYVESSGPCGQASGPVRVVGPPVDISALSEPTFEFRSYLHGEAVGTLSVEFADGLGGWHPAFIISGDQGEQWNHHAVSLAMVPAPMGVVHFRFVREVAPSRAGVDPARGDVAIETVRIGEPSLPDWQLNQPGAALVIGDVDLANGFVEDGAVTRVAPEGGVRVQLRSSLVGQPWDVAYIPRARAGANIFPPLPGNQQLNVDVLSQRIRFLQDFRFTNAFPGFVEFFPQGLDLLGDPNASSGSDAPQFVAQMAIVDPALAGGLRLSQAAQTRRSISPDFPVRAGTGNDNTTPIELQGLEPVAFGRRFDFLGVSTNGRVLFEDLDTGFLASPATARTDAPFIGMWTDLDLPSSGSSAEIVIDAPAPDLLSIAWSGLSYYLQPSTSVSFTVMLDRATGDLIIDGLSGVAPNPISSTLTGPGPNGGDAAFLGLSPGRLATGGIAVDPGSVTFFAGATGQSASFDEMLYEFQAPAAGPFQLPSIATGTNTIRFTLTPSGYAWSAF